MKGLCLDSVDLVCLAVQPLVLADVGVDAELASGDVLASQVVLEALDRNRAAVAYPWEFLDFDFG
jgi:hypothetical protein